MIYKVFQRCCAKPGAEFDLLQERESHGQWLGLMRGRLYENSESAFRGAQDASVGPEHKLLPKSRLCRYIWLQNSSSVRSVALRSVHKQPPKVINTRCTLWRLHDDRRFIITSKCESQRMPKMVCQAANIVGMT